MIFNALRVSFLTLSVPSLEAYINEKDSHTILIAKKITRSTSTCILTYQVMKAVVRYSQEELDSTPHSLEVYYQVAWKTIIGHLHNVHKLANLRIDLNQGSLILLKSSEIKDTNNNKLAYLTWLPAKGIPVPNWMNSVFFFKFGCGQESFIPQLEFATPSSSLCYPFPESHYEHIVKFQKDQRNLPVWISSK
ncbi:hypothetical protein CONCODRAFT_7973 [Conidiobolus coronatus NRRL 28638]|uniref:Uncharacterized protein n=1 Tax=Conidiobolus coronatus (strain ATCC 28846 / CBS 209.66 / NRRL 28638) TaxID=796925 RepID=A0A137P3G7_CONC2|nr:hypothetical protein CONCODRAFT_7973 [Conidiobolus coronatus NRRL 28638]|eukprot:KXN69562.1 hypothetical protein CONCODRAFT_7973 [Conidiobolus coronatus NRRL 28638]